MDARSVERVAQCPVCGATRFQPLAVPGHWIGSEVFGPYQGQFGLCRCRSCSVVFVNPRPTPGLLERFYSGDTYSCHRPQATAGARRKADFLLGLLRAALGSASGKRLLDFGCGGGSFLARAREQGWDAVGFDIGSRAVQSCRAQGLTVYSRLEDLPSHCFAAITLNHVFEHLQDHRAVLTLLKTLLAPDGRLLIEVPNRRSLRALLALPFLSRHCRFDERYRAFPIHLLYFNRASLTRALDQSGFTVERMTTVGLGLEELLLRADEGSGEHPVDERNAEPVSVRPGGRAVQSLVKDPLKRLFYGSMLGENLLALARARE